MYIYIYKMSDADDMFENMFKDMGLKSPGKKRVKTGGPLTMMHKGKPVVYNDKTPSFVKNYDPLKDPEILKFGKTNLKWTLDNYDKMDTNWWKKYKELKTVNDKIKGRRDKEAREIRESLIEKKKALHLLKCQGKGPRLKGFRINPSTKMCRECPGPKKHFEKRNGKMICVNDSRFKNPKIQVPKRGKDVPATAVLAPTGRYVLKGRADKYKFKKSNGEEETIDLLALGSTGRKNLWLKNKHTVDSKDNIVKKTKKTQAAKTYRAKTVKKSVSSYNASPSMKKKLAHLTTKNEYRSILNNLLEQKRKQRTANTQINCEIRKWKMGNNPHIIEQNRNKLVKMTDKACRLSEQYLTLLTDIQVLKNASYEDANKSVSVKKGGARKTRNQRKRRNRTKKRY